MVMFDEGFQLLRTTSTFGAKENLEMFIQSQFCSDITIYTVCFSHYCTVYIYIL